MSSADEKRWAEHVRLKAWLSQQPCEIIDAETAEARARVAREDRAAEVRLRGEPRVAELEREANK